MFYYIRNTYIMTIEINTCGREGNFICNWLGTEILIEVCLNTVWLFYIIHEASEASYCVCVIGSSA